ncbi:alpha/beta hydrolase family protein [Sphingomonas koreensis]
MKYWIYLACLSAAAPAAAQGFDAARAFGARESVEQASLSPDGTKLAYLAPIAGQGSAVFVVRLDDADAVPARIMNASGDPERLQQCRWASNSRLVCNVFAVSKIEGTTIVVATRIVSFNDDGSKIALLHHNRGTGERLGYALFGGSVIDWNPGGDEVLMMREYVPETSTGSRLAQKMDGIGVDAVDPVTLKTKVVEIADPTATEYITDGRGTVRIRGLTEMKNGYSTGARRYYFRPAGERGWKPLSLVEDGQGFDPYGVDPTLNIAYGLKRINGRLAAYSVALDGTGTEKLVFAHDSVDVTGFARIGRNGRIIGARYTTDVGAVHYFDPAVGAMIRMLSKALPKLPLIQVIDSSEDENRMLIWAGSDTDPGRYFLLDRAKKGLNELMLQRPELENATLAAVKHITYPAADGTMVPAYLTLPAGGVVKGLPAIVLPHGGPEARDEWGFDWLSQFYASQGFAVLQPNFRGSAGYGDAWLRKNGFQSWKTAIGDVSDAGRWLVKEGIADPAKLSIVGWSYGGYAALQSAAVNPDLFKRVVAIAPVTDLERLKTDARDFTSANEVERFIGSGPHIQEGSPARNVDAIKAPVLMFHGDMDRNVLIGHSALMQSRLAAANKTSELVTFKGLDHYLEDSNARTQMLQKSAEFLKAP